ncbi:MAG: galactose mutarotase [Bacteroidetes bacterium]|nr:galactose mutarotase [Bacteroidota bacterium]
MQKIISGCILVTAFILTACNNVSKKKSSDIAIVSEQEIENAPSPKNFESTIDNKPTALYILKNGNMQVMVTNYGARIVSIIVPDKNGKPTDVAVGYAAIKPYTEGADTYFGAIVGRYGNRIAKGKFNLDGKTYSLATNDGPNHLHGGKKGFSRQVWDANQTSDSSITLTYISGDGEEGYPGTLTSKVTYTVNNNDRLKIEYAATTTSPTILNLTNHTYFNLNGEGSGTVNNHLFMINATTFTPIDSTFIPIGKLEAVKGTPFDFTTSKSLSATVNDTANRQIKNGKGYDHNFVLNTKGNIHQIAAEVSGDQSGIVMDVYTTQPGLQFYGGNFMDGSHNLKYGKKDDYRTAFCMETQHYPDSPNEPGFPSTVLKPGETFSSETIYAFSAK